jgi:hypothetical protein
MTLEILHNIRYAKSKTCISAISIAIPPFFVAQIRKCTAQGKVTGTRQVNKRKSRHNTGLRVGITGCRYFHQIIFAVQAVALNSCVGDP